MCAYVWVPTEVKEDIGSPGAGVAGSCEPSMSNGKQTRVVFKKQSSVLNSDLMKSVNTVLLLNKS